MIGAPEKCVMRLALRFLARLLCVTWSAAGTAVSADGTIATYHRDPGRSGNYVVPTLG